MCGDLFSGIMMNWHGCMCSPGSSRFEAFHGCTSRNWVSCSQGMCEGNEMMNKNCKKPILLFAGSLQWKIALHCSCTLWLFSHVSASSLRYHLQRVVRSPLLFAWCSRFSTWYSYGIGCPPYSYIWYDYAIHGCFQCHSCRLQLEGGSRLVLWCSKM